MGALGCKTRIYLRISMRVAKGDWDVADSQNNRKKYDHVSVLRRVRLSPDHEV